MRRVATFTALLLGAVLLTACACTSGRASTGETAAPASAVEAALRCTVSLVVETDGGDSFGTGIIFDNTGHVITVHHVVEDANRIVVLASGGKTSNAIIVGADPIADLALLKIESGLPEGLSPAKLAKAEPRPGQKIWSVGNPFGTSRYGGEPSVSSGVISTASRSYLNDTTGRLYLNALQHDASTNPGNSGGGVFNLRGELLGLTALITTMHGTGSDSGVAFAIPSVGLPAFVETVLAGRVVEHGWLGEHTFTQATEVNPDGWGRLRTVFGQMVAGGPGDSSGILPGDVIVKIDGKTVYGLHEVLALVDGLAPEAVIEVLINRGGIELPITVVVGQRSLRE